MARYETEALTANGRSEIIRNYNAARSAGSITKLVSVTGTFGGGTATLQLAVDHPTTTGSTWVNVEDSSGSDITFTENGSVLVDIPSDDLRPNAISINLTGATSPNLNFVVFDAK